jgi:hypothetical protein
MHIFHVLSRYSDGLRAGRRGFESRQGQDTFLYPSTSRRALGSTQPLIQLVPVAVSSGQRGQGVKLTTHFNRLHLDYHTIQLD